jgi:glutamate synthase domain-containing protein 2
MMEWTKTNDVLGTANRGINSESGLCTLCRADCKGKCETWLSAMKGRKLLYPRDFGSVTAGSGNTVQVGVSYNSVRIQGYLYGAEGRPKGVSSSPDDCLFTRVGLATEFGWKERTRCRVPLMTGALGSTFVAAKYWDSFAIGAALAGFPIVIGENVVGIDREAEIQRGRIRKAPELDRRIETFLRYYDGTGAVIVQLNVEDARNGVAEYVIGKYGDKVIIELKWGQGAKSIGGEIQVTSLEYAQFLVGRGYLVDPDPMLPEVQEAYRAGAIKAFARHSRLGYTDLRTPAEVEEAFANSVAHLRGLGYRRISLKTGSYGMEALAMAIKYASDNRLDLLTLDGSGGGTGMSPWHMMDHWGVTPIFLHAKAWEYADLLARRRKSRVVDLAFAGTLAREDQIFKALALGAPYAKMVCMGRAMMIPAFVGSNIEGALHPDRRERLSGQWDALPPGVTENGAKPEEIFASYFDVQKRVGASEMKNIPYGAIAIWTFVDKIGAGLQQLLAGARRFSVGAVSRDDLMAANRETEKEIGIPFMTDALDRKARKILGAGR